MKLLWDDIQLVHEPKFFLQRGQLKQHYEVPARAQSLLAGGRAMGLEVCFPPPARRADLQLIHSSDYLDFLERAAADWAALPDAGLEAVPNIHPTPEMLAQGAKVSDAIIGRLGWYTADLAVPIASGTWDAALAAAACAYAAAEEAAAGRHAYALTRPPGHHAYAAHASGHCYLNNAALAAQCLREHGAARVGILDIDSHHGNGTQGIFWTRGDVVVTSVHGDPDYYYPWYVGRAREIGVGDGRGANLNLPLPAGSGDEVWLEAIMAALAKLEASNIDALVVSLGFDASRHEPLGFLKVSDDGFAQAGARIAKLGRPCAIIQEGGYAVEQLGNLLQRFLTGLGN